jgi:DNA-binding transcriptional LysR family regulator
MTLEQLRIFVAVAEALHMTRAAERLHLTQSAVSAAIASLEERHSVRLFDRVGRHLELSDAGRTFLPEARSLILNARRADQTLDDLAGLKRGALAIAGSQTVFNYWLPVRAARFTERHPAIALTLIAGNTAQVAEAVRDGTADLGFVEGVVDEPRLSREKIATDRIAIYAAKKHPLAGKPLKPSDLSRATWILREEGSGTRAHFENTLRKKGIDPSSLKIVMSLPSNEAALAAVEDSAALTAVSTLAALPHIAAERLAQLRYDLPERNFELIAAKERSRSRAAMAFLEMLR